MGNDLERPYHTKWPYKARYGSFSRARCVAANDHISTVTVYLTRKVKVKVRTLAIVPLTWVSLMTSSALQSWKWQLIGMSQWWRIFMWSQVQPV